MKKYTILFLLNSVIFSPVFSQTITYRDTEIENMVQEISGERIEQDTRTLLDFHTRHNLSEQNNSTQGIGAAWNWIKAEMEKIDTSLRRQAYCGF